MDAGGSRGIKPKGEVRGSSLPSGRLFFHDNHIQMLWLFVVCPTFLKVRIITRKEVEDNEKEITVF